MRTKKIIFLLLVIVFLSFTTGCLGFFNNKPIIGSTPGTTAKVGIEYTYEIDATDPDDDVLAYSLSDESEKPTGMVINGTTGAVSWIPTEAQVGVEYQIIIEVNDGNVSVFQNFPITVVEAELSSIEVVPSEMRIPIGDSETIASITAYYDNETTAEIELDSDDVSYTVGSTDTPDIITVSTSGVVTGVSEGIETITVSYTEGETTKTAEIGVTVPSALTAISVLPEFMVLYKGSGYSESINSITASYDDEKSASIELSDATYISDTSAVATVSATGVVTGKSAGTATITVTYTEGAITKTDMVYITVQELVLLDSITVVPSTMSIIVGNSQSITSVTANYDDLSNVTFTNLSEATYFSGTPAVATVSTSGVVTGASAGTAVITVSYTETGITETDTVAVTVTE